MDVQRYKVGYYSDEWGMSSNTPCLLKDDKGYAVKFEDYEQLRQRVAELETLLVSSTKKQVELTSERDALIKQRDDLLAALENCRKELSAWMRDHGDDIATQDAVRAARATIASVKGGAA